MHVAIVNLTSGGFSGGYRKYLRAVLPLIRDDARVSRVTVFSPPRAAGLADAGTGQVAWPEDDARHAYRWLKAQLRSIRPDVVFIPTARHLSVDGHPTVVMVRNMEPLVAPFAGNSVGEALKNVVRRRVARRSCERATRVIAVSEYVREFVVANWGILPRKVGMVYHGVELATDSASLGVPAALSRPHSGPLIFTAGSIRPARGLEDLVRALPLLRATGVDATLAIAGEATGAGERYRKRSSELAETLGVADRIVWTGLLSAGEMAWCFRHADVFVMTSRAEACPNTALEAMSHGALCVSGGNAPMPEFFRDSALYYRSGDAVELADCLRRVLIELSLTAREELRNAARARAAGFTWAQTATRTVEELIKSHADYR